MATAAVIKGLQNAVNRFFGVTFGTPLVVDGKLGPATLAAIDSIVEWMPGAGYDTTFITSLTSGVGDALSPGGQVTAAWGAATIANVSLNAQVLSNALDNLASANEFETGVVPGGGTPKPPSVAMVQTPAGKRPAIPAASLPKGPSQIAAAGLLGLGLPDWAVYAGGAGLVAVIGLMIAKRKKTGGVEGVRHKPRQNAYGLTWVKWFRAAGFSSEQKALNAGDTMDAWYRGEDPSDWRAEQQSRY
jgi:hypothetical protein